MRQIIICRPGMEPIALNLSEHDNVWNVVSDHYQTYDVKYVRGSINHGSSNEPMMFMVTILDYSGDPAEQFEIRVYKNREEDNNETE